MKEIKLNNVIFPIWLLMFFPPIIFITITGNFIIDSLVIVLCFFVFKLSDIQDGIKIFYKKSILKVWLFGFIADIIGAAILLVTCILGDFLDLPRELISAIVYNPLGYFTATIIVALAMLVSAAFIFLFNYKITFRKQITEKKLRLKVAFTIAITTMPWTFLIPIKWF